MAVGEKKLTTPWMVFAEQVPEAARLHDPSISADERDRIRRGVRDSIDVVKEFADRNTQRGRHAADHAKRERVMAGLRVDARGKPKRGEPSRLAAAHGVPVIKIRKWIEQLRKTPRKGSESVQDDWRTVVYGKMLRHERSMAGRQRTKHRDN
jgi:hypothetical protein